jgi:hypothetical protein
MSIEIPDAFKPIVTFAHPVLMWILFAVVLYLAYTGIQARRTRSAEGETKKELVRGKFRDKHYVSASVMLAAMIFGAIGGMAVTYINNGKLFVGPHLIVGLGMTALVGLSAALAPAMQKGNDLARNTHIALNIGLVGLFGWQALTGVEIVQRILSN